MTVLTYLLLKMLSNFVYMFIVSAFRLFISLMVSMRLSRTLHFFQSSLLSFDISYSSVLSLFIIRFPLLSIPGISFLTCLTLSLLVLTQFMSSAYFGSITKCFSVFLGRRKSNSDQNIFSSFFSSFVGLQ